MLGIAARNTVLMITRFQQLEREEGEAFGPQLILRAAGERVGPILVTAIATALALVPLLALGGGPGYELLHPMAAVVIGGLVTSTLIALLVVPALYSRLGSGAVGDEEPEAVSRRLAALLQRRARERQKTAGKTAETLPSADQGA